MKYLADYEYTFVTSNGCDFMVWFDENGNPTKIYTYRDTGVNGLNVAAWTTGLNPLFIHCPEGNLTDTIKFLEKCGNLIED